MSTDDGSIQSKGFSFLSLTDIKEMDKPRAVDLIGVVVKVEEMATIMLRSGVAKDKRMVHIADESGMTIQACFWSDMAHSLDNICDNPVIAIKNIRVVEFHGRSLNQHEDTFMQLKPEIPRARELKTWFDSLPNLDVLKPMVDSETGDGGFKKKDQVRLVAEMNQAVQELDRQHHERGGQGGGKFNN